ncbi:MAG: oligosaccharide flippase family protein [Sulfitobacter sp.]|nr:oligosaccharide flippase family protein [Sulfitobacter sp.]
MIAGIFRRLSGGELRARVARSASWIILGYGGSQALRLASNLILTRLLFPEAFGLMALVATVTVGLTLFSDIGIAPSIAQSKRGDDPDFLDTAFTIQAVRGLLLWGFAAALAWPAAQFYGQPDLLLYLPLAGVSLFIAGFNPTRIETAHRHLQMGRLTLLDLTAQMIALVAMVVLALLTQSVLALVLGGVIDAAAKLVLSHLGLAGHRNRFRWESRAAAELVTFGKWIFLSTAFWFFASQGDKLILGKFLSLQELGIYNIGFFLASFPVLLAGAVTQRVMIPVYREGASAARISRLRYLLSTGPMVLLIGLALLGPWLVGLLYDDRYLAAGVIVTVLALAQMPQVIGTTYDQAALAAGDSRRFFIFSAAKSSLQFLFLLVGAFQGGLLGAMVGLGLAMALAHLVVIWLARAHGVWEARHDALFALIIAGAVVLAVWLHGAEIMARLGGL